MHWWCLIASCVSQQWGAAQPSVRTTSSHVYSRVPPAEPTPSLIQHQGFLNKGKVYYKQIWCDGWVTFPMRDSRVIERPCRHSVPKGWLTSQPHSSQPVILNTEHKRRLHLHFTFTFRAFSRRFYPKRLTISTFVIRSATIYLCRYSKDVHRTKCKYWQSSNQPIPRVQQWY